MSAAAAPKRLDLEPTGALPQRTAVNWGRATYIAALVATDCLAVLLAFFTGFIFRTSLLPKLGLRLGSTVSAEPYFQTPWLLLIWPVVFYYEGLYRAGMGAWDECMRILKAGSFAALLVMGTTFVYHTAETFSRIIVLATGVLALISVPALRNYVRTQFLAPWFRIRFVLVTGADRESEISRRLEMIEGCGYQHLRTLVLDASAGQEQLYAAVSAALREQPADEIMLYPTGLDEDRFRAMLRCLESTGVPLRILSNLPLVSNMRAEVQNLDGLLLFDLENGLAKPFNRLLKRAMDILGAAVLSVLCCPILLLIGIVIKLDSRGGVFFGHTRLDSRGRLFRCIKFRSMYQDADQRLREWLETGGARAEEFRAAFKLKDDPRITRVGKILRRTSLDELPQLINVLRGEMSLVGPRPIVPEEVSKYADDLQYLLMAKGGMTGLWQVSGRSDVGYGQRVLLDSYYTRNWSVWSDLVILLKTPLVLLKRTGAY